MNKTKRNKVHYNLHARLLANDLIQNRFGRYIPNYVDFYLEAGGLV